MTHRVPVVVRITKLEVLSVMAWTESTERRFYRFGKTYEPLFWSLPFFVIQVLYGFYVRAGSARCFEVRSVGCY